MSANSNVGKSRLSVPDVQITPVSQRHQDWCALACIESATRDRGGEVWTQERLQALFGQFFPAPDHAMKSMLLPTVCFSAGVGNCFHLGQGRAYIEHYGARLAEVVIFIATQRDAGGGVWGHSYRLTGFDQNGYRALNPSTGQVEPFDWGFLATHDCLVYVVGRADLAAPAGAAV